MYLHNDKQLFEEVVSATANEIRLPIAIIEKDYYVTMILKELSKRAPECVFKGGTSLSKCHHVIDRFALVKVRSEKAAVLLDEFRIH